MAGHHEGQHLIDQLALGHRLAGLLVARRHEHREVVEVLFSAPPAALDEPGDQLGERAELEGELQVALLLPGDHLERVAAELAPMRSRSRAEDRAQHDLQCELAHLVREVHRLAAAAELLPARR